MFWNKWVAICAPVILYLGVAYGVNFVMNSMVFLPPNPPTYTQKSPFPITWIITKKKRQIPAHWITQKGASKTILYSHPNAVDLGVMFRWLEYLSRELNVNILHYEYIGYGLASYIGKPSENTTYESIEAAHQWLNDKGIENSNILVHGVSVGSGPSVHLASREKNLKGLLLEAPFVSCIKVVMDYKIMDYFDIFKNIDKIDQITAPFTIIHGEKDQIVPFSHGVKLWDRAPEKYKRQKLWLKHANHNNLLESIGMDAYVALIKKALE